MVLREEPPDSLNCERGRLESPQAPNATRHSPDLQKTVLKVPETQKYPQCSNSLLSVIYPCGGSDPCPNLKAGPTPLLNRQLA